MANHTDNETIQALQQDIRKLKLELTQQEKVASIYIDALQESKQKAEIDNVKYILKVGFLENSLKEMQEHRDALLTLKDLK